MKPVYILFYGLLMGFVAEFFVSLFHSFFENKPELINWSFYLIISVVFLLIKISLDRAEDEYKLDNAKIPLLALSIIMSIAAIIAIVISRINNTSDPFVLTVIALGLPNMFALIYWSKTKLKK